MSNTVHTSSGVLTIPLHANGTESLVCNFCRYRVVLSRTISMVVNIIITHRLRYLVRVLTSTSVIAPGTQVVLYLLLYSNSTGQDAGRLDKILIIGLAVGKIRHQQASLSVQ